MDIAPEERDTPTTLDGGQVSVSTAAQLYIDDLIARRDPAATTLTAQRSALNALARSHVGPVVALTAADIDAHLRERATTCAQSTVRHDWVTLRTFFAWAVRRGLIDRNPMRHSARPRMRPRAEGTARPVTREEVDRVLGAIPEEQRRDRALFLLLAESGSMLHQALALRVEDVRTEGDGYAIRMATKYGPTRLIRVAGRAADELRAYLAELGIDAGPLFPAGSASPPRPLGAAGARARWRQHCAQAAVHCPLSQVAWLRRRELLLSGLSGAGRQAALLGGRDAPWLGHAPAPARSEPVPLHGADDRDE